MNYKPNKNSLSTSSRWLIWLTFFGLNLATLVAEARIKSTQTEQAKIFLGPDSDGDGLPDIEEIGNIKSCTNQWPPYIINTPRTVLRPPS